jgi:hypothetical protein
MSTVTIHVASRSKGLPLGTSHFLGKIAAALKGVFGSCHPARIYNHEIVPLLTEAWADMAPARVSAR